MIKLSPGGETGTRTTLKMLRAKAHVGSSPTPGTISNLSFFVWLIRLREARMRYFELILFVPLFRSA